MNNADFTFDDTSDPLYYLLTTTKVIPAKGTLSLGLNSTIDPQCIESISTLNGIIVNGSGSDSNDKDNASNALFFFKP